MYNKDSRIIEVFSNQAKGNVEDANELRDAHDYIKELAAKASPESRFEISQIMKVLIDDNLEESLDFIELIADTVVTDMDERALFEVEYNGLQAMWQAKSGTTRRSELTSQRFSIDTEEVSIRPKVNFNDLVTGKVDVVHLADLASKEMEVKIVQRIQDTIYDAFKDSEIPNYASGSGITKGAFDPILHAMKRAGGNATIIGDGVALTQFTELAGFGSVPEALAIEHNQNGRIGTYLGSPLVQLYNPFAPNTLNETRLRQDLIYVVPNVQDSLKPVKVQFEGDVQAMDDTDIDSKVYEFRFDQRVGVAIAGIRHLLGVYEDLQLGK